MTRAQRFRKVIEYFRANMPTPQTELQHNNPYQLVVATILSAQCTDKRVNLITPAFFEHFPTPSVLAQAKPEEVFQLIRSCTYPNSKTRNLLGMAKGLVERYNGTVPMDVKEMQTLPGIGRKTANVVVSVAFNQPAIAVDTHVFRVARRIGLSYRAKTPLDTERQLMRGIPKELWAVAHHWLILHGRYTCTARRPRCSECGIRELCKEFGKVNAQGNPKPHQAASKSHPREL